MLTSDNTPMLIHINPYTELVKIIPFTESLSELNLLVGGRFIQPVNFCDHVLLVAANRNPTRLPGAIVDTIYFILAVQYLGNWIKTGDLAHQNQMKGRFLFSWNGWGFRSPKMYC